MAAIDWNVAGFDQDEDDAWEAGLQRPRVHRQNAVAFGGYGPSAHHESGERVALFNDSQQVDNFWTAGSGGADVTEGQEEGEEEAFDLGLDEDLNPADVLGRIEQVIGRLDFADPKYCLHGDMAPRL